MDATQAVPPGWHHNPSRWSHRLPMAVLSAVGCAVAVYLGLVQVGVFGHAWDPLFGGGSDRVLRSGIAEALPVPDALLGAAYYAADLALLFVGASDRWRSRPWAAVAFGLLAGPAGLTSLLLVIAQPLVVGAWCTLCLLSAACSLAMAVPASLELWAALHEVRRRHVGGAGWAEALFGTRHFGG